MAVVVGKLWQIWNEKKIQEEEDDDEVYEEIFWKGINASTA